MAKQHDKQFKLDAIQYYQDHKDLGVRGCAENLGIGYSTLTKWLKDFRESGDIQATENMQRSYSKKAFPWDNACIESFHSIIKREWLNRFKIRDYKQAYQLIF